MLRKNITKPGPYAVKPSPTVRASPIIFHYIIYFIYCPPSPTSPICKYSPSSPSFHKLTLLSPHDTASTFPEVDQLTLQITSLNGVGSLFNARLDHCPVVVVVAVEMVPVEVPDDDGAS